MQSLKKNWQVLIGNDVVDLQKAAAESNWQRKRYLEKICTGDEQQLIWEAKDSSLMFWIIWTMKESAYKIINRETGIRSYHPLSLQCKNIQLNGAGATGIVNYQGAIIHIITEILKRMVHSIAVSAPTDFATVKVFHLQYDKNYMEDFNQSSTVYRINKINGLPEMANTLTGAKHAVSISHHGSYLAIAYSDSPLSKG